MWSLNRVLVFSGAAIAGGGSGGGAIYKALGEDIDTTKKENDALGDGRLAELERKLVELKKKGDSSYNDLASKILPNSYNAVFDLDNNGTAFQHGKGATQRKALSDFCSSDRKGTIDSELAKRICER